MRREGGSMGMSKLTVRFEDPFWVGVIEVETKGATASPATRRGSPRPRRSCASYATGGGSFASPTASKSKPSRRSGINPKRLRRMIEREIKSSARRGTKAQQALAEQREAAKEGGARARSRARREDRRRERFAKKAEKRKREAPRTLAPPFHPRDHGDRCAPQGRPAATRRRKSPQTGTALTFHRP